jgi:hypothetical protein
MQYFLAKLFEADFEKKILHFQNFFYENVEKNLLEENAAASEAQCASEAQEEAI